LWGKARLRLRLDKGEPAVIKTFLQDETGLELSEYAVAAALITLAVIGAFTSVGNNIQTVITNLATNIK
jgi:Flp pilus assembly pilin Flp